MIERGNKIGAKAYMEKLSYALEIRKGFDVKGWRNINNGVRKTCLTEIQFWQNIKKC